MDFALAGQYHFMQFGVLLEMQRGVFLDQLADRGGEFHFVLAVGRFDGEAIDRRQKLHRRLGRYGLAARQHLAGLNAFEPHQRHRIARLGFGEFALLEALQCEDAADARVASVRIVQNGAVFQRTGHDARQRQFAAMGGVIGLEDAHHRIAVRGDVLAGSQGRNLRHFVAQRLQEAADAVIILGGTDQHGHDQSFGEFARQIREDFVALRFDVGQQFLPSDARRNRRVSRAS